MKTVLVPLLCGIGRSDAGKTTFHEKSIHFLIKNEFRGGTIKHDVHGFDLDVPVTDS